ncbi:putative F420-dependent oxidoreductase [Nocardioides marinisabuli]|uniref:Putative F420-dependent oxidoreductase n=1 Tax=Nocardioides marinisabuli TaxID=419476 RepID=A0A7Y9F0A3_9ACTN|nr:TIGR03619 family F420-dependent LLM class oxidoreductase [Nocardioides marinisabuli]NYD57168.1 putative F420-dependent oxidoreductase [Nocardioides marinisabuli]
MHIGIMMFSTDQTVAPAPLARMIADRGFEAMFLPEHSHIPATRKTPYPRGGDLPPEYYRTYDMFVGLAAAAVAAPTLTIGTGITVVPQHDPIYLAKQVASLDHVSDGRLIFGIGFGWNQDEIEDHGVPYKKRRGVTREKMLAVRRLWTEELASFEGEHVSFSPSYMWPKPAQPGGPPVVVGGLAGPKLFEHIAEYADGWAPIGPRTIMEGLPNLQRAFEEVGRDSASIRLHAFDSRAEASLVEHYASLGVERLVINIDPFERAGLETRLDELAPLVDLVR